MEVIYDLFKSFGGEGKINKSSLKFRQNIINSEKEYSYIDPKRRFKVEPLKLSLSYLSRNTVTSYKLTINKNGRNKSLYIKVALDNYSYRNAAQEMILLKYLEQNGISIIKPRFAFSKTHLKKGIHFIAYDFTFLKNVTQGYLEKLISEKEFLQIKNNLMDVTANFMLKDSIQILDITPKNCFYKRLSNGEIKLYLIDVFSADFKMLNSEYLDVNLKNPKEILDFAKNKGIVK